MRFAFWIIKATNTHSEYEIIITLPQQQWLHDRASMLSYKYITRLITLHNFSVPKIVYFVITRVFAKTYTFSPLDKPPTFDIYTFNKSAKAARWHPRNNQDAQPNRPGTTKRRH
jgi:hypothetical protein